MERRGLVKRMNAMKIEPTVTLGNILQIVTIGIGGVGALITLVIMLGDLRTKDAIHDEKLMINNGQIKALGEAVNSLDDVAKSNQIIIQQFAREREIDRELRRDLKGQVESIKERLGVP